jgi:predicted dehydrogenase
MRALFFGAGAIGQRHMRNLRQLTGDGTELIAYRVRRLPLVLTDQLAVEEGTSLETKLKLRVFNNLDEALATRPDVAFICNPTSLHMAVALEAARAGCHLFIEKPLSHSLEQVDELIGLVERSSLVATVAYQLRFHPLVKRMRELLAEKAIGRVVSVHAEVGEYLPGWHPYEDYRQSYAARADLGGGAILTQIHEFDYLYSLFGLPRRIFALGGQLTRLELDVEDTAGILMESVVDGRPIPIHVYLDYIQRPPTRTCRIVGDAGKMILDFRAATLVVYGGDGSVLDHLDLPAFERNQMFLDEMAAFLRCIERRETPVVSLRDGAQSLRMAMAAKESMRSREVVQLSEGYNDAQT